MNGIERTLVRMENLAGTLTVFIMLAIMLIVASDVALRYLLNSPIPWAFDLIGLYLMAGVFFLSLSGTYADHGHVGVDILLQKMSPNMRRMAEILTCLVAIPFFAALATVGAGRAIGNFINNDALSGLIAWPTWIAAALVPLGSGLLLLRLIFRLVGHVASLITGRNLVTLMPLGGHEGME